MKDFTSEQIRAFEELKGQFDKIFNEYGNLLKLGKPVKIFTRDTEAHRLVMEEFRINYLVQRAEFEGWNYNPGNLEIIYHNDSGVQGPDTILYNPRDENRGFEVVDEDRGLVSRLNQRDSDWLRDRLQSILGD